MIKRNRLSALALVAALILAPFTPALTARAAASAAIQQQDDVPSDAEQAMFTKGQTLYNQGRYDQAVTVLQDFLKTYPRSIITDLTLLWLGRSYMQLGKLKEAEQVGTRLHAIKDTPFAEIYDSELETARAESGTRAINTNQGGAIARAPETRPTPGRPATRKIPEAQPTPTPSPRLVTNITPKQSQPSSTGNKPSTTQNSGNMASTTQPKTATSQPPTQIASNAVQPTRRNPRPRPRLINTPPTIPSDAVAGQTTASSAATRNRAVNNPPRVTPQPKTEVAINNTPRTTTPKQSQPAITQPTPRPTPVTTSTPAYVQPPVTIPTRTPETVVSTPSNTSGTESAMPQTGGLNVTVRQVPALILSLNHSSESAQPGQSVQLPLTVTNKGNKDDQFRLETDLPAEYQPSFSLAQSGGTGAELPILVTPQIAPGSSIEVMLNLRVPETAADGQQTKFLVRAASQADYQISKVNDGMINVVAASLAGATNVSNTSVMPGETFTQTITVRNNGSSPARATRADFIFNPNFELVNANPAPINYDRASRTAIWSLGDLGSRGSHDISVTLRAVPDALASTNPLGRGAIRTQSLPFGSNFDSPSITVGKVPKARIDSVSVGLTATPGDTIFIPFVVRNPGNAADSYELRVTAPGAPAATIYADLNGDGQHQESEPTAAQTAQLDPRNGQFPLLLRVQIPASTPDRQQFSYNVVARSLLSGREASEANTVLTVATPRVRVRTEGMTDSVAPGDTIFYRLVLVNEGSGLAKNLVVNETLPDALQFVSSDPSLSAQDSPGATQRFTWRVSELAPGDTAVLRIAVRLRQNQPADAVLTTRHTLGYQDSNGNSYTGQ